MSSDHDAVDVRVEFDGLLALLAFHGALGGDANFWFRTLKQSHPDCP